MQAITSLSLLLKLIFIYLMISIDFTNDADTMCRVIAG